MYSFLQLIPMYEKNIGYPINDVSADYLKKINYVPAVPENLFET